jgi:hypothetical protein
MTRFFVACDRYRRLQGPSHSPETTISSGGGGGGGGPCGRFFAVQLGPCDSRRKWFVSCCDKNILSAAGFRSTFLLLIMSQ